MSRYSVFFRRSTNACNGSHNNIKAALADVAIDGGADGPAVDTWWGEPGLTGPEKVYAWNSFAVLAMKSGIPDVRVIRHHQNLDRVVLHLWRVGFRFRF